MAFFTFLSLYRTIIVKINSEKRVSVCRWGYVTNHGVSTRGSDYTVSVRSAKWRHLCYSSWRAIWQRWRSPQHQLRYTCYNKPHSTGTTTYFILASTPTPLNSYLSLIHSSVQILFMILFLLSSPASLHCSTPSITWRFIRERLKSDVGVALPTQLK